MKTILFLIFSYLGFFAISQDYYDQARAKFHENDIDSARYFISKNLALKPNADDYFLSAMIHEAENKDLRALADYEAVIQSEPNNLEAYFQKGLIYYNSASTEQAIKDFTFVLNNQSGSETKAIYYGVDPTGANGTFLTTLQTMISRVYQYRGMAYKKLGDYNMALQDFSSAFEYDTLVDCYINRSLVYDKMGDTAAAIGDLKSALQIDSTNYHAWYNLAILDESTKLPSYLLEDEDFLPMLSLVGANAYESGDFDLSAQYYSKAIEADANDDFAYIGRGKALLRMEAYGAARQDFMKALQLNPSRTETFYLIGNSLFHEKRFKDAIGFYEQYLSVDTSYGNVWFNAAMAKLSLKETDQACSYLKKASELGISQADAMLDKHCDSQ